MRLITMKQRAKSLSVEKGLPALTEDLSRIKWYLWHGNIFRALRELDSLSFTLEGALVQQLVFA